MPSSYFEDLYESRQDPWGFTDRWYEQRKRALTLAALPARRYRRAFEPGCSLGVFTGELAERCDVLISTDVSQTALRRAAGRVPSNVELRRWGLGEPWPEETFDLVVLSEVGYYLSTADLPDVVGAAVASLEEGGTLVAAHWRHEVADYPQDGDAVHATIQAAPELQRLGGWRDEDVVIEVWEKCAHSVASLARREGLV
ncbi:class I SAM-dependent DNA methyltransferase [Quadrisphaera setariae]|uniref:class I SAM-dependent DNA methyltransferase n=1 Tax=Quadrisphaera setariae TaxID=2593304 RepID=UPI0034E284E6